MEKKAREFCDQQVEKREIADIQNKEINQICPMWKLRSNDQDEGSPCTKVPGSEVRTFNLWICKSMESSIVEIKAQIHIF